MMNESIIIIIIIIATPFRVIILPSILPSI
jgi:hypothetical protein